VLSVAPEIRFVADQRAPVAETSRPIAPPETYTQVLARFGGNRQAAAQHLGISRTTLWRKLQQE
ncbi:MAG TPA: helix-turn-helix domain-containing protein, partial [Burkholderiaceae bacterium]|nr:helix-turn-helix domain-containing protein [Burkholderiaceae bacterium]